MTIGIVTQRFTTGDGQGAINLAVAEAALDRGHRILLVGIEAAPHLQSHPNVTWAPVPASSLPTQLLRDLAFAYHSYRWLRTYRSSLDILMVNGAITWCDADVNALHFVHDAWRTSAARRIEMSRSGLYSWYHRLYTTISTAWERWALRRTRHAVAVSPMVAEQVRAIDDSIPVHVIPNGVDPKTFSPNGVHVSRSEFGCPPNVPLALFVGDIRTGRKNLDTILHALSRVPDLHLAVAGSVDKSPFPALANTLGVASRVHFLDFRRDTPALMRTADFLVCPSRYDPFSLVQLEGMACGLPVVTARTVGASALVTRDSGIVLEDPTDTEALADAIHFLSTHPTERDAMGRAARTIALEHDLRSTASKHVDLFDSLHADAPVVDPVSQTSAVRESPSTLPVSNA